MKNSIDLIKADLPSGKKDELEFSFITFKKSNANLNAGDTIVQIASSFYFVTENDMILDVASDFELDKSIFAVGVIDSDENPIGVISRRDLFDRLGKNFGRDLYKNKKAVKFMTPVKAINYIENIYSVAEDLGDSLYHQKVDYHILSTNENKFAGVVSTRDILFFLSEMTQADIKLATKLQGNIVKPSQTEESKNVKIIGTSRMAKGVGGDFYAIKRVDDYRWLFMVCDVTGKGVSASLVSAIVGGMFNMFDKHQSLKKYISKLNNYIQETFMIEKYLTGMFLDFDEKSGLLKFYDMGHSLINIFRNGKCYNLNQKKSAPVGIKKDIGINPNSVYLKKGDRLLVYSDGVSDQRNTQGEFLGDAYIKKIILNHYKEELNEIKERIFTHLDLYRGNLPQSDDITFIIMDYF